MRNTEFKKTHAILAYGQVDILWTYQEARIKILILLDFCLICEPQKHTIKLYLTPKDDPHTEKK